MLRSNGSTGASSVNKGGFSWKRATGITRAKTRISRRTGLPLTRSGRQRKVGAALTGCLLQALIIGLLAPWLVRRS